jgi:hypothetical protein
MTPGTPVKIKIQDNIRIITIKKKRLNNPAPSKSISIFHKFANNFEQPSTDIVFLRELSVIQWIFGDTSFLPEIEKQNATQDCKKYKELEDIWGQTILAKKRPDLQKSGNWTTVLGEEIGRELFILQGKTYNKPANINGFQPDGETEENIIEVKTQTYFTSGTAGEKIMGVPHKYADIPELYKKPLKILCIACAEKLGREKYGVLPGTALSNSQGKQKNIAFYKSNEIEYIGATDIIWSILL